MSMLLLKAKDVEPGMLVISSPERNEIYGVVIEPAVDVEHGRFFQMTFLPFDFASATSAQERQSWWALPKAYICDSEWGSQPFDKKLDGNLIVLSWMGNSNNLYFYVPIECLTTNNYSTNKKK